MRLLELSPHPWLRAPAKPLSADWECWGGRGTALLSGLAFLIEIKEDSAWREEALTRSIDNRSPAPSQPGWAVSV